MNEQKTDSFNSENLQHDASHEENMHEEHISTGYESLLRKALNQAGSSMKTIGTAADEELKQFGRLSIDEIDKLHLALKRDLSDAAYYLNASNQELADWLGFDLALIKHELWQKFSTIADNTSLELIRLKKNAELGKNAELEKNAQLSAYKTGEIVGLGTLVCDRCAAHLHFYKAGHISPCASCHGSSFHRQYGQ